MPDNDRWRSNQERYRGQDRYRDDTYGWGRYEDWGGRAGRGRFRDDEPDRNFDRGPAREMGGRDAYGSSRRSSDRTYGYGSDDAGRTREYGGFGAEDDRRLYPDYARESEERGYRGGSRDWLYDTGERQGRRDFQGYPGERRYPERAADQWPSRPSNRPERREGMSVEGVSHRGRGPKGYQRSDDRIREDISDRLTDDPRVDASEIEISVTAGEVTLSGTVNSRFEKRHAEDIAETVSGVKHVQNNLRVNQQGTGGAWANASATLGTAARPDLVRTKGSPDDFVTGNTTPDAAKRDKGDVPGPGLGSV